MPTDLEFQIMEKSVVVMKPLVSITEAIGAEKWITISMIKSLVYKLIHIHLVENSGDTRRWTFTHHFIPETQYRSQPIHWRSDCNYTTSAVVEREFIEVSYFFQVK